MIVTMLLQDALGVALVGVRIAWMYGCMNYRCLWDDFRFDDGISYGSWNGRV